MQAAWRAAIGKDPILDQNPLMVNTTIPEEVWDRRYAKRKADAQKEDPGVSDVFDLIDRFKVNLDKPGFDYFPSLIHVLVVIDLAIEKKSHAQLAMELTNYLKKLVRRKFNLHLGDARSTERRIQEALADPTRVSNLAHPLPASAPPSSAPSSVELGAGGFGVVFKPALPNTNEAGVLHEYPDNVTKVFIESENRDKILELAPRLDHLIGPDEGHRINTYKKSYKGRNVSEAIRRKLRIRESNNIFPIRMPDLGVSIGKADTKKGDIRKVPIPTIIDQVIKVLKQVQTLQHNGSIHGDIRETNVMIHPTTGTITIIDFDLLKPANIFRHNGMYNNPPESLILDESSDDATRFYDYTVKFYKYFFYVQDLFKADEFLTEMAETEGRNQAYMDRVKKSGFDKKFLTTYDSFGLACTLLCLFSTIYPGSIAQSKEVLKNLLSQRTTKNGVPYTGAELDACTNAIYDMSHSVLLLLSKFRMDFRPNVDGVLETALSIQRELNGRMSGTETGSRVGGRRKTRKTRKTRKSVRRQKK